MKLLTFSLVSGDFRRELQIYVSIGVARMPNIRGNEGGGEEGDEIHIQLERLQKERRGED